MKLSYRQIEGFVKSPPDHIRAILVYGPDDGLMRERAKTMAKTAVADLNDPFNAVQLTGEILAADPARLSDEANAISMMGGKRLVHIHDAVDTIAPSIKEYLQAPNENTLIVVEAGNLRPSSALRKLFEKEGNAAAVPCYVEEERDMTNLIRDHLREQGYSIASDAVTWLAAAIVGDRQRARSEIEKLITYMGDQKQVGLSDVMACCGDAGAQSLDDLVYGTGGGRPQDVFRSYRHLCAEGVPDIVILRSLQNHFRRLHLVRTQIDSGTSLDLAMKKLSPPVFFKQDKAFKSQVSRWRRPSLETVLQRLTALEAQCKTTGMPTETLCSQALLAISSMK